jgi:ribosomal protein S11
MKETNKNANYNLIEMNRFLENLKLKKQYACDLKKKMLLLLSIKSQNYKKLNRFLNLSTFYLDDSSQLKSNNFSITYIIDFSFTRSNTFLHVMDFSGNLKFYYSAGLLKYKGKKKRAKAHILKYFYNIILTRLKFLKGKPVILHFKNVGRYYRKIFRELKKKLFVTFVTFFYTYPYNGCRKKKI